MKPASPGVLGLSLTMGARRLGAVAIGGAATTWLAWPAWQRLEGSTTALAEAPRQVEEDVKQGSVPARLKAWLQGEQGADVSSLEFKPSKASNPLIKDLGELRSKACFLRKDQIAWHSI
jgi:hypothetical protein